MTKREQKTTEGELMRAIRVMAERAIDNAETFPTHTQRYADAAEKLASALSTVSWAKAQK